MKRSLRKKAQSAVTKFSCLLLHGNPHLGDVISEMMVTNYEQ